LLGFVVRVSVPLKVETGAVVTVIPVSVPPVATALVTDSEVGAIDTGTGS